MKWRLMLGWLFTAAVLLGTVNAQAIVFQSTDAPPYWSAQLADNGFGGAMLQLISAQAKVDYRIEYLPVKRFSKSKATFIVGNPDLLEDAQQRAIFPFGLFHAAFFFYTPHHEAIAVHSLRDMKGHTLGVLRGSIDNTAEFIRNGIRIEENDSVESLIKKLKRGRIDFCILAAASGRFTIQQLFPQDLEKFTQVVIPSITRPIAIMIDVQKPEGKMIAQRYQQVLQKTLHSQAYQTIVEKFYGKAHIPPDRDEQLDYFVKLYATTWNH